MTNWFGKAGMGMHVSCLILRKPTNGNGGGDGECQSFDEHTYNTFIGKANQDFGAVMAIYQSVLEQVKKDVPQTHFIIDKSDNAGCYHNQKLFAWKVYWPRKNLNLTFLETIFKEWQSRKDQCDRDSAKAKR